MLKTILSWLLTFLAAYLFVVAYMYVFQRSFIYFPDTSKPVTDDPRIEQVQITTRDGARLISWYMRDDLWREDHNRPVILLFHGNASNIANRVFKADYLLDLGYDVFLLEYRGYGGNPRQPTEAGLYLDAEAALSHLMEDRGIPAHQIVLYGESLGSGVAVEMAANHPYAHQFGALILEAPFRSAIQIGKDAYPFIPVGLVLKDRFETENKIAGVTVPVFIMHGARDKVIAQSHGKRLFDLVQSPKAGYWPDWAGHNDIYARPEPLMPKIAQFMDENLRDPVQ